MKEEPIMNYLEGTFKKRRDEVPIQGYEGTYVGVMPQTSPLEVSKAFRAASKYGEEDLEEEIGLIEGALSNFLKSEDGGLDYEKAHKLSLMTGKTYKDLEIAMNDIESFSETLREYKDHLDGVYEPKHLLGTEVLGEERTKRGVIGILSSDNDFRAPIKTAVDLLLTGSGVIKADSRQPLLHYWFARELDGRDVQNKYQLLFWEHTSASDSTRTFLEKADEIVLFGDDERLEELQNLYENKIVIPFPSGRAQAIVGEIGSSEEQVANDLVHRAAINNGKECRNPKKTYVVQDCYEDIKEGILEEARRLKRGPPIEGEKLAKDVDVGYVGKENFELAERFIEQYGLKVLLNDREGDYGGVIVTENVNSVSVPAEDIPAPLIILEEASSLEEAIASANNSCEHSLDSRSQLTYAYSVNDEQIENLSDQLETHLVDSILQRGGLLAQSNDDMDLRVPHHGRYSIVDKGKQRGTFLRR